MRLLRALVLACCASRASRALAQHEGHSDHGAPALPARFDFQASLLYADYNSNHAHRWFGIRDVEHFRSPAFASGRLSFRGMTSLGALIPDSAGMPSLLQTGGTYRRAPIYDRQHAHDLVMEAAAEARFGHVFLYVAPVGDPALGPVSYLHRPSAAPDPVAPLGHHWQDASHGSYGVVTVGGLAGPLTLEASAFNARESDTEQRRPDFANAHLDSYSVRLSAGTAAWRFSSWYGYLTHHSLEFPAMQMHRFGASASSEWRNASSIAVWGTNIHHHDASSHALMHGDPGASPHLRSSSALLETTIRVAPRQAIFARAERVRKSAEELGFQGGDLMQLFDVRALAAGARRDVLRTGSAMFAVGLRGALTVLPRSLETTYGTRRPVGLDVFLQARSLP